MSNDKTGNDSKLENFYDFVKNSMFFVQLSLKINYLLKSSIRPAIFYIFIIRKKPSIKDVHTNSRKIYPSLFEKYPHLLKPTPLVWADTP